MQDEPTIDPTLEEVSTTIVLKPEPGRKPRRGDHVRLNTLSGNLECQHCGETYHLNLCLPAPLEIALAVMKAFKASHRKCKLTECGQQLIYRNQEAWARWTEAQTASTESASCSEPPSQPPSSDSSTPEPAT